MNHLKLIIVLTFSYLIAFITNFIPSLKHPDTTMNIFNLLTSFLLLIALLLFIKNSSYSERSNKIVKSFLIFGFISGLAVYIFKIIESTMKDYAILDIILSIQYPLYVVFITPLFGLNYLVDVSYETFSLLMSVVYVCAFILVMTFNKVDSHSIS